MGLIQGKSSYFALPTSSTFVGRQEIAGLQSSLRLFVSQRDDRIDPHRSSRREIAPKGGDTT
jgi:hypothetical protein